MTIHLTIDPNVLRDPQSEFVPGSQLASLLGFALDDHIFVRNSVCISVDDVLFPMPFKLIVPVAVYAVAKPFFKAKENQHRIEASDVITMP